MSKYRRRSVFVLLGIAIFVIGLSVFRSHEPSFEGKPLRAWLDDLSTADEEGRALAKEAVLAMGPGTIPYLLRTIGSIDSRFRRVALEVLGQQSFIKMNFKAWEDQIEGAAAALLVLGPAAAPAVPELVRRWPDQTWLIAACIESVGPAVLTEAVVREAIPVLIEALKDGDVDSRDSVRGALAAIGEDAVIPLSAALKHSDSTGRKNAAQALGLIARMENIAVRSLTSALVDLDTNVQQAAAEALGLFGSKAKESVPKLVNLLGHESLNVRVAVAGALERIAPGESEALNLLTELLSNKAIRVEAAAAIGSIGAQARHAVPELIKAFAESSARADEARNRLDDSVEPGTTEFKSLNQFLWPEDYFRTNVAIALGKMGPAAALAVPILLGGLTDRADWVRSHSATALGKIGPLAKDALPHLIAAIKDSDHNVRKNSAAALAEIDQDAGSLVAILVQVLEDEETEVRINALNGLAKLQSKQPAVIEALVDALQDPKHKVRLAAIAALSQLGADAETVAEPLRHATGDRFPSVRKAAQECLRHIASHGTIY